MRKTPITALSGSQAQAAGLLPHPLISKRRATWNRFILFFGLKPFVPNRPKWSVETGLDAEPLDEQLHMKAVADMPLRPIGATQEGTESAQKIMEGMRSWMH